MVTMIFTFGNNKLTYMKIKSLIFVCFLSLVIRTISSAQTFTPIIFTEINYNSDSTMNPGNWIELYNKTSSSVNIGGWYLKTFNNTQYPIPSGTMVSANGYLVIAQDLVKFNPFYPTVTNVIGSSLLDFANNGDSIQIYDGTNTLISYVAYKDSLSWPRGADKWGRTIELQDYNGNLNDGGNWFDGCMFGSPGVAYTPCNPDIVFSEINYNSSLLKDAGDWVEIHNTTGNAISLNGYSLKDSKDSNIFFFPAGITLPANGYREVVQDVTKFITRHPNVSNFNGPFPFGFRSKGETIRLFGPDGKLQFSVLYDNKLPWPETPDSGGYTLELLDEHGKMNDAANWFAGCPEGSPGWPYAPGCNAGVTNLNNSDFNFNLLSNLVANEVIVNVTGLNNSINSTLSLIDIYGRKTYEAPIYNGTTYLNTNTIPAGFYLLNLTEGLNSKTLKFVTEK